MESKKASPKLQVAKWLASSNTNPSPTTSEIKEAFGVVEELVEEQEGIPMTQMDEEEKSIAMHKLVKGSELQGKLV